MKFVNVMKVAVGILFHLTALVIIGVSFWPIASWYYFHCPILGVDFFNTVTHVRLFAEHFSLPPWAYRDFWFGGSPLYVDFSIGWYYPIAVLARFFPIISAVKLAMLVSFFAFLLFIYLTAYRLSRHHLFSALVTVLVAYCTNMYGSLTWGGSLPYFANQMFFPFSLWTVVSYLDTGQRKWFWATTFVVGLAFLGHAMNAGTYVLIFVVTLLLIGWRRRQESIKKRIGELVVFFLGFIALSNRVTTSVFMGIFAALLRGKIFSPFRNEDPRLQIGEGGLSFVGNASQINWERSRMTVLFSDMSQWIFAVVGVALAMLLVAFVVEKEKRQMLRFIPWILLMGYLILHVFLNSYGFPFLHQGWYRAFWSFPVMLSLFAAVVVGYCREVLQRLAKSAGKIFWWGMLVLSVAGFGLIYQSRESEKTIALLEERLSPSSAFPEAINLVRNDRGLEELKPKLTPEWLDPLERNWRLYESDAQVNVWWNALFDMPLVRGYIDSPIGIDRMGQIFLTDQTLGADGLVTNFHYPVDVAKNMALYYLDWNAIKYFEGGHVSISDNKVPSSYLADAISAHTQVKTVGLYRLYQTPSGRHQIMDIPQYLEYYRFKDELVSPVLSISNAPAVLCFCDWSAYQALIKVLSMNGLHSRFLVTAFSEEPVDQFSLEDLSAFDLVYLANYKYRNGEKAFQTLSHYVSSGGKVFIDTGGEVRESERPDLPELFPFSAAARSGLGRDWKVTFSSDPVFEGIDFQGFSPLVWEEQEWKLSYPVSDLDPKAEVLLSQGDKPILVRFRFGEGTVLWSGINLAFHVNANTNVEESRLYVNLLNTLVPLSLHEVTQGEPKFFTSRKVGFSSNKGGKGILFKEQLYRGWKIRVNGKPAEAYTAGPAYPGYMYVPTRGEGLVEAKFDYWGRPEWYFRWLLSLFTAFVLLDLCLFDGWIIGQRIIRLGRRLAKQIGSWWEREEE